MWLEFNSYQSPARRLQSVNIGIVCVQVNKYLVWPIQCIPIERILPTLKIEIQDAQSSKKVQPFGKHKWKWISSWFQSITWINEVVLQSPQFKPSTSQMQAMQQMYMHHIEGPKMNWTVNDNLYHRLLKWEIKYENILDSELAVLPEGKKCKKKLWSGQVILELTNMYHGAYLKVTYAWRWFGTSLKSFASLKPMRSEPGLTS